MHKRCPRCLDRVRILVTSEGICLSCAEWLAIHGGKWTSGDDAYIGAVRAWLEGLQHRFNGRLTEI